MFHKWKLLGAGGAGGEEYWVASFYDSATTPSSYATAIVGDGEGNTYVGGFSSQPTSGTIEGTVCRINADGTGPEWAKRITANDLSWQDYVYSLAIDSVGDVFVGGSCYITGEFHQPILLKLNPTDGSIIWKRIYRANAGFNQFINQIEFNDSGDIIASMFTTSSGSGGDYDTGIFKINPSTGQLIAQSYEGHGDDNRSMCITIDSSGDIYQSDYRIGGTKSYIAKWDQSLTRDATWQTAEYVGSSNGICRFDSLVAHPNGNLYGLAKFIQDSDAPSEYMSNFFVTINKSNSQLSNKMRINIGSLVSTDATLGNMVHSNDGDLILLLNTQNAATAKRHLCLLKMDPSGNIEWANRVKINNGGTVYAGYANYDSLKLTQSGDILITVYSNTLNLPSYAAKLPIDGSGTGTYGDIIYETFDSDLWLHTYSGSGVSYNGTAGGWSTGTATHTDSNGNGIIFDSDHTFTSTTIDLVG